MAGIHIGTPGTTNLTIQSDDFGNLGSPEKSFAAPQQSRDLIGQLKGSLKYGANLKTPRGLGRDPLRLLPNGPHGRDAFTPLMKSVTKTNMSKRMSARRGISLTPGLPSADISNMYSDHNSSSIQKSMETPMPHRILSSSAASTPLAQLPDRNGHVVSDGNVMTLREQEGIIDKIEKENFGLKMKIHFLEENLSKRGNEFNQAALKENTDLKVTRITMQKELHKFKKTIAQAEKDAEKYRRELEEYKERKRQKHADESVRIEVSKLQTEMDERQAEYDQLRSKYELVKTRNDSELNKLRDELADVQADLRERDRQLGEREDEIDQLKSKTSRSSNAVAEVEDELTSARQEIEDLRHELQQVRLDVKAAEQEHQNAEIGKRRAEDNLKELEDEMANKSFVTKGLSRQLQEKATRFEDDYHELQERFEELQRALTERSNSERRAQERLRDLERDGSSDLRHMQQDLDAVRQQKDSLERKLENMNNQAEAVDRELQIKIDEKNLLQSRHDALTTESAQLQDDMARTQKEKKNLEIMLEQEKSKSGQTDAAVRQQHDSEVEQLTEQIDVLHRELNRTKDSHIREQEQWQSEYKSTEAARDKAEERAAGLQRTIDKLNEAQGTLSGREIKLQEAFESEQQRHQEEEKVLQRQIDELNNDLASKRTSHDASRNELNNAKEELRISIREQALLKEKVQELEDEIDVLQQDLEQEHELAQQVQQKSTQAADSQVTKLRQEKSELQEKLATVKIELESARRDTEAAEAKLEQGEQPRDDTFDIQSKDRDLKREKQRLERELEKTKLERDNLAQTNKDLEDELDVEIERATAEENKLHAELDKLRHQRSTSVDGKERELVSAKNKIVRLETRVHELEQQLEVNSRRILSPGVDISGLQSDMAQAREKEADAVKRETALKVVNRDLKMKVNDLERDLHEARLVELKAQYPSSVSSSNAREVNELRKEVFDTRSQVKTLQDENSRLKRQQQKRSEADTQYALVQTQLECKTDELVSLSQKLEAQNNLVDLLRRDIARIRADRDEARQQPQLLNEDANTTMMTNMRAELKRLRAERDNARHTSLKLAGTAANKDALVLKHDLARLRQERGVAVQRSRSVEQELDIVQARYEDLLERLTIRGGSKNTNNNNRSDNAGPVGEKEIQGLVKEILWLKAKCRREQRLRQDLAWSKAWLENNEAMRVKW